MPRRLIAVLATLAASGGLVACGGGDEVGDVIPRDTPELVPPGEGSTTLPDVAAPDDAATTSTTDTTTTPDGTDPATGGGDVAPTPAPAPAPTPAPATPPADSGGTPAPTPAPDTGGGTAEPDAGGGQTGGFSDFCAQNPGACGE